MMSWCVRGRGEQKMSFSGGKDGVVTEKEQVIMDDWINVDG
jgi:hypothetical protein